MTPEQLENEIRKIKRRLCCLGSTQILSIVNIGADTDGDETQLNSIQYNDNGDIFIVDGDGNVITVFDASSNVTIVDIGADTDGDAAQTNTIQFNDDGDIFIVDGLGVVHPISGTDPESDAIYILATGQSNMSGFNDGDFDTTPNPLVEGWNGSAWVMLERGVAPMGWCTPGTLNSSGCGGAAETDDATGSYFYFAKRLQEKTGKLVRVISVPYAGQAISNWLPEASTGFTKITDYMTAIGNPHIDYFIWDQGEADTGRADTDYKSDFDDLVAQLDAQPFFGKDVPIFIVTTTNDPTLTSILNVQYAIGSGQFDKRYTVIDAADEPVYPANPIHFSAEGQYNIANKMMEVIYNKLSAPNAFRQTDSTERAAILSFAPTLSRGIIHQDPVTKEFFFANISNISTDNFLDQLTLSALNDSYGAATLKIQNSGSIVGAELSNTAIDATLLNLKTSSGANGGIIMEHRGGSILAANSAGEVQNYIAGIGNVAIFGASKAGIVGSLNVGSVATAASTCAQLEVTSTTKGLLLPRMTKAQRDAISTPLAGLAVYQTDNTPGLRVYNGTNWMRYTETAD